MTMRITLIAAALLFLYYCTYCQEPPPTCGMSTINITRFNGSMISETCELPWLVKVKCGNNWADGTIISNRSVIIAARYIWLGGDLVTINVNNIKVMTQTRTGRTVHNVTRVYVHPDFTGMTGRYDVAILILSRPLTFSRCVRAACLPNEHQRDSSGFCIYPKLCDFTGTTPIGSFSRPKKHRLYTFRDDVCKYNVPEAQTDYSLCGKTTVSSDNYDNIIENGPPLICENSGLWYIYGIGAYHRKEDDPPVEWITFIWTYPTTIRSFINTTKDKQVRETPSETRRLLIAQVIDAITEAHMATTINTHNNVIEANKRIAKMKESHDEPDLSKLSRNASSVWQQFHSSMVPEITKVIRFCKKLPGFSEVEQEDQNLLIKQGTFEVMVARFLILVDHVNEMMFDPHLQMKSPRYVIREMPIGPFLDEFFDVALQFNPLGLSDGEIGLFTAILMIYPDREGLRNSTAVRTVQQLFMQALYYLLKQGHTDADLIFRSLLSMIPVFRKVSDDHAKFMNSIKMKSSAEFERDFTFLHQEVFGSGS